MGSTFWFDEIQASVIRRGHQAPPLFKFTLKDSLVESLSSHPQTVQLAPLVRPRRVPVVVSHIAQNYLFVLDMKEPHATPQAQAPRL